MRLLLTTLAVLVATTATAQSLKVGQVERMLPTPASWQVSSATDGDTVKFKINSPDLPGPLGIMSIRIYGVDTPEKGSKAKCLTEQLLADEATAFTRAFIRQAPPKAYVIKWDKYGGRVNGDIVVNGQPLSQALIAKGLAKEYYGQAKTSWCD